MTLRMVGGLGLFLAGMLGCGPKVPAASSASTAGAAVSGGAVGPAAEAAGRSGKVAPEPLVGELVTEGGLPKRVSRSAADLVVFYGGELKGSLETCGCPKRPRGSVARLSAYVAASRAANPGVPDVLVNAGYWLQDAMGFDGQLRSDVTLGNRWMVEGVRASGWDALNVGYPDVAGLSTLPADDGAPLPLVSANVVGPGINRWVIVQKDGLRVGITGITAVGALLSDTPAFTLSPPMSAGPVIEALAAEADVIVLLAYSATEEARKLAAAHPEIDVVVDAALHREWAEPLYVRNAAWGFSHLQTMRLGELRLDLAGGRVVGGLSRQIDLDPEVPDDPTIAAITRKARVALDAEQRALYGP